MNTTAIAGNCFEGGRAGRPMAADGGASFRLVEAFGERVYSMAKHITQNDEAAEDVLIETFLEVCPDLNGCEEGEEVWLRLVTIAVREAIRQLHHRGEGRPLPDGFAGSHEELVLREFSVWGDNHPRSDCRDRTTILECGLRSLDPMCRTVFVLRDIEDIAVERIAEIVNRCVAAVEVCLLRARLQLRETLTRQMRRQ